uniref:VirB7 type IV secretion protein n=1 Tax=Helicobacter pylori TaxID=210 RepID=A0A060CUZ7_HELPX|nr:VirB7 type IV secretion protein [Helicobacter pylori]
MRIFLLGIILLALSGCSNKQYEMHKSPCAFFHLNQSIG